VDQKEPDSPLAVGLAVGLAILLIQIATYWDRMPFMKEYRIKKAIEVVYAGYNSRTNVLAVRLRNPNLRDVKNVDSGIKQRLKSVFMKIIA
jgi:hypothetical protein